MRGQCVVPKGDVEFHCGHRIVPAARKLRQPVEALTDSIDVKIEIRRRTFDVEPVIEKHSNVRFSSPAFWPDRVWIGSNIPVR